MTNWVDELSAKRSDEQKRADLLRAETVAKHQLIEGRAPAFWASTSKAVRSIAAELDQKLGASLGGVKTRGGSNSVSVESHGKPETVTVNFNFNPTGQQITVGLARTGNRFMVPGETILTYTFKIGEDNELYVSGEGERFADPEAFASAMLQRAFTEDLLRPY